MSEVKVTKEQFHDYQRLQFGGLYNMMSSEARELLELTKEEHQYIINNYSKLLSEYGTILLAEYGSI